MTTASDLVNLAAAAIQSDAAINYLLAQGVGVFRVTDDVLDKQRGYIERERLSPSQALLKAVKYVMSRAQPPAEKPEEKGGLSRADRGTERKEAAVAKNVDAANRQPASTKKAGADSDKHGQTAPTPEADQMTYEEFSALPDSTKAKMRGDFVA